MLALGARSAAAVRTGLARLLGRRPGQALELPMTQFGLEPRPPRPHGRVPEAVRQAGSAQESLMASGHQQALALQLGLVSGYPSLPASGAAQEPPTMLSGPELQSSLVSGL